MPIKTLLWPSKLISFPVAASLTLFLLSGACESKPTLENSTTSPANNKANVKAIVSPVPARTVEYAVQTSITPRRGQNIESPIALAPAVKACMRQHLQTQPKVFFLKFKGLISSVGDLEKVEVTSLPIELKPCAEAALNEIHLGPGAQGLFVVEIASPRTPRSGAMPKKTLLLNLDEGKKLE